MKRIMTLLLSTTMLSSCYSDGLQKVNTGNEDVKCVKIATVEGRNVYRLQDGSSEFVYFVINPTSTTTAWITVENKRTHPHQIESE